MDREGGNKEKMRKCGECISLHFLILSIFPLHFIILSPFSHSQAGTTCVALFSNNFDYIIFTYFQLLLPHNCNVNSRPKDAFSPDCSKFLVLPQFESSARLLQGPRQAFFLSEVEVGITGAISWRRFDVAN